MFPNLLTGLVTAAGGSWNASIVSEYVSWGDRTLVATGLGSYIAEMTAKGDFPRIALGIAVMSLFVVGPQLTTLPVALFRYVASRTDPLVAAISALLVLLTLAVVIVLERAVGLYRAVSR